MEDKTATSLKNLYSDIRYPLSLLRTLRHCHVARIPVLLLWHVHRVPRPLLVHPGVILRGLLRSLWAPHTHVAAMRVVEAGDGIWAASHVAKLVVRLLVSGIGLCHAHGLARAHGHHGSH